MREKVSRSGAPLGHAGEDIDCPGNPPEDAARLGGCGRGIGRGESGATPGGLRRARGPVILAFAPAASRATLEETDAEQSEAPSQTATVGRKGETVMEPPSTTTDDDWGTSTQI